MITATTILRNAPAPFDGEVSLDYEGRLLRRRKLASSAGDFMVDLPETTSLEDGDAFELSDGRTLGVPLAWFPRLFHAAPDERQAWRLVGGGRGIHWAVLDEDISIAALLAGLYPIWRMARARPADALRTE